jgi:hypothetical protein
MTVSETAWPITLTPCASTVTVVSAGTVTVVVVEVEVSVAVLVVVEVVPTVEVWVAILSQDEQKALAEVYERSFVTQGATDTAAQVPVRTLLAGAEETMGTRSTVAKRRAQTIMMNRQKNE